MPARVIKRSTLVRCESPAFVASVATIVTVEVSVDGLEFFGGHEGGLTFMYSPPPVFDGTGPSISPSQVGIDKPQDLTITGAGFPRASILAPGYPLCRFTFSATSLERLSQGETIDSSSIKCPSPSGAPDERVDVAISFNGVEFHPVLTSVPLQYVQRPAVVAAEPAFAFPDSMLDLTLSGARLQDISFVGHGGLGPFPDQHELAVTTAALLDSVVVPGAQYQNVSTVGDK